MNKNFKFQEDDFFGESTLKAISSADKFNAWMYDQLKPYINGRVLEIGSGIGNISKFLVNQHDQVTLSDIRDGYVNKLKEEFKKANVLEINLTDKDFDVKHKKLFGTFDFIFALNVIEHIEDDKLAMANIHKLLNKGGLVFILVPAYQVLYNHFDTALEHYRRYNERSLKEIFSNYKLIKSYYFNFMGIFGWFLVGKILGRKVIPESNMKAYNFLVPIFKLIDKILINKIGLSVIQVAKK